MSLENFTDLSRELATRWFSEILLRDIPPIHLVDYGLWCKTPGDAKRLVQRIDEAITSWRPLVSAERSDRDRVAITALIAIFNDFATSQRSSIDRCLVGLRWESTRIGLIGLLVYVGVDVDHFQCDPQTRQRPLLKVVP